MHVVWGNHRVYTMASKGRVCRFCRSVVDPTKVVNLFTSTSILKRWAPRLSHLLGIPVERNNQISSYMCKKCSVRVESLEKSMKDLAAFQAMAKCSLSRVKETSGSMGASPTHIYTSLVAVAVHAMYGVPGGIKARIS